MALHGGSAAREKCPSVSQNASGRIAARHNSLISHVSCVIWLCQAKHESGEAAPAALELTRLLSVLNARSALHSANIRQQYAVAAATTQAD